MRGRARCRVADRVRGSIGLPNRTSLQNREGVASALQGCADRLVLTEALTERVRGIPSCEGIDTECPRLIAGDAPAGCDPPIPLPDRVRCTRYGETRSHPDSHHTTASQDSLHPWRADLGALVAPVRLYELSPIVRSRGLNDKEPAATLKSPLCKLVNSGGRPDSRRESHLLGLPTPFWKPVDNNT